MTRSISFLKEGVLFVCLLLSGCSGGQPFAYQPDHELKPGPGIFSGKDGEFTLIGTAVAKEHAIDKKQGSEPTE